MKINEAVSDIIKNINGSQPTIDPVSGNSVESTYVGNDIIISKSVSNTIQGSTISMVVSGDGFVGYTGFGDMSDKYLFSLHNSDDSYSIPFYPCITSNSEASGSFLAKLGLFYDYQTNGYPQYNPQCRVAGTNSTTNTFAPGVYSADVDVLSTINTSSNALQPNACMLLPHPVINMNSGSWSNVKFSDSNFDLEEAISAGYTYTANSNYDHCYIMNTTNTGYNTSYIMPGMLCPDWVIRHKSDDSFYGLFGVSSGKFRLIIDVPTDRTEFDTHHIKVYQNFCIIYNNVRNFISRCIYDLDLSLITGTGLRFVKLTASSGATDIGPINSGDVVKIVLMPSSITLE